MFIFFDITGHKKPEEVSHSESVFMTAWILADAGVSKDDVVKHLIYYYLMIDSDITERLLGIIGYVAEQGATCGAEKLGDAYRCYLELAKEEE